MAAHRAPSGFTRKTCDILYVRPYCSGSVDCFCHGIQQSGNIRGFTAVGKSAGFCFSVSNDKNGRFSDDFAVGNAQGNRLYMLSSDVSSAYDPLYADAFEKKNTAFFGRGLVLNKYTGSRGKNNTNDASAEYIAKLRKVMDENELGFQTAEMGRVDLGGSGTIAYIMANYGMNVIDSGVAVLSMHAPHEVTSKSDIYEVYRGYKAFLKDMK